MQEWLLGLGSSAVDCIYAGVGAFGLKLVSDFLLKYETVIHLLGGCLVIAMGISAFFGKQKNTDEQNPTERKLAMFLSAFAVGITNPAAILTFLFAFSYFDLSAGMNALHSILLICGVLLGTLLWWLTLSSVAVRFP
ncbi:MAG: LysE family transporter [Lachnospiraceae bacterium]|nr:LysE family transporter [Lachnospiraceae bacterium]